MIGSRDILVQYLTRLRHWEKLYSVSNKLTNAKKAEEIARIKAIISRLEKLLREIDNTEYGNAYKELQYKLAQEDFSREIANVAKYLTMAELPMEKKIEAELAEALYESRTISKPSAAPTAMVYFYEHSNIQRTTEELRIIDNYGKMKSTFLEAINELEKKIQAEVAKLDSIKDVKNLQELNDIKMESPYKFTNMIKKIKDGHMELIAYVDNHKNLDLSYPKRLSNYEELIQVNYNASIHAGEQKIVELRKDDYLAEYKQLSGLLDQLNDISDQMKVADTKEKIDEIYQKAIDLSKTFNIDNLKAIIEEMDIPDYSNVPRELVENKRVVMKKMLELHSSLLAINDIKDPIINDDNVNASQSKMEMCIKSGIDVFNVAQEDYKSINEIEICDEKSDEIQCQAILDKIVPIFEHITEYKNNINDALNGINAINLDEEKIKLNGILNDINRDNKHINDLNTNSEIAQHKIKSLQQISESIAILLGKIGSIEAEVLRHNQVVADIPENLFAKVSIVDEWWQKINEKIQSINSQINTMKLDTLDKILEKINESFPIIETLEKRTHDKVSKISENTTLLLNIATQPDHFDQHISKFYNEILAEYNNTKSLSLLSRLFEKAKDLKEQNKPKYMEIHQLEIKFNQLKNDLSINIVELNIHKKRLIERKENFIKCQSQIIRLNDLASQYVSKSRELNENLIKWDAEFKELIDAYNQISEDVSASKMELTGLYNQIMNASILNIYVKQEQELNDIAEQYANEKKEYSVCTDFKHLQVVDHKLEPPKIITNIQENIEQQKNNISINYEAWQKYNAEIITILDDVLRKINATDKKEAILDIYNKQLKTIRTKQDAEQLSQNIDDEIRKSVIESAKQMILKDCDALIIENETNDKQIGDSINKFKNTINKEILESLTYAELEQLKIKYSNIKNDIHNNIVLLELQKSFNVIDNKTIDNLQKLCKKTHSLRSDGNDYKFTNELKQWCQFISNISCENYLNQYLFVKKQFDSKYKECQYWLDSYKLAMENGEYYGIINANITNWMNNDRIYYSELDTKNPIEYLSNVVIKEPVLALKKYITEDTYNINHLRDLIDQDNKNYLEIIANLNIIKPLCMYILYNADIERLNNYYISLLQNCWMKIENSPFPDTSTAEHKLAKSNITTKDASELANIYNLSNFIASINNIFHYILLDDEHNHNEIKSIDEISPIVQNKLSQITIYIGSDKYRFIKNVDLIINPLNEVIGKISQAFTIIDQSKSNKVNMAQKNKELEANTINIYKPIRNGRNLCYMISLTQMFRTAYLAHKRHGLEFINNTDDKYFQDYIDLIKNVKPIDMEALPALESETVGNINKTINFLEAKEKETWIDNNGKIGIDLEEHDPSELFTAFCNANNIGFNFDNLSFIETETRNPTSGIMVFGLNNYNTRINAEIDPDRKADITNQKLQSLNNHPDYKNKNALDVIKQYNDMLNKYKDNDNFKKAILDNFGINIKDIYLNFHKNAQKINYTLTPYTKDPNSFEFNHCLKSVVWPSTNCCKDTYIRAINKEGNVIDLPLFMYDGSEINVLLNENKEPYMTINSLYQDKTTYQFSDFVLVNYQVDRRKPIRRNIKEIDSLPFIINDDNANQYMLISIICYGDSPRHYVHYAYDQYNRQWIYNNDSNKPEYIANLSILHKSIESNNLYPTLFLFEKVLPSQRKVGGIKPKRISYGGQQYSRPIATYDDYRSENILQFVSLIVVVVIALILIIIKIMWPKRPNCKQEHQPPIYNDIYTYT